MHVRLGSLIPELEAPTDARAARRAARSRSSRSCAPGAASASPTSTRARCCSTTTCRPASRRSCGASSSRSLPPLARRLGTGASRITSDAYDEVAKEFAALLDIDPWLINPIFGACGEIDFQERAGEECLRRNVDDAARRIRAKYAEYGIDEKPFVIVKADAGTYGMGIMTRARRTPSVTASTASSATRWPSAKEGLAVSAT